MRVERDARRAPGRSDGFTVVELAISLTISAILVAMGYGAFRQYAEATVAHKVALQIASDISLARSHAIQRRENISLVASAVSRSYVIRDTAGTPLGQRDFGPGSDLPIDGLTLSTGGDSLTFNSRGLLLGGTAELVVARGTRSHEIRVNGLGRATVD